MNKLFAVFIALLCCPSCLQAQQWLFNHQLNDAEGRAIRIAPNGTRYLLGYADDSANVAAPVLTLLNGQNNVLSWKQYADTITANGLYLCLSGNGQQLAITGEQVNGLNIDYFITLTDLNGQVLQHHVYGTPQLNESLKFIQPCASGGYIACGFITQTDLAANDFLVVRFDSAGNRLWQQTYGGKYNDYAQALREVPAGGWVVSGDRENGADIDNYLLRIDTAGQVLWDIVIGDQYDNGNQNVIINHRGNYVLCGESTTAMGFEFDLFLAEVDTAGNFLWSKYLGGTGTEAAFAITQTTDRNYLLTGYTTSAYNGSPYNAYLLKLDSNFQQQGLRYLPQQGLTIAYDMEAVNQNTVLLAGTSASQFYIAQVTDTGLHQLFTEHTVVTALPPPALPAPQVNALYHNGYLQVAVPVQAGPYQLQVYNVAGQCLAARTATGTTALPVEYEGAVLIWHISYLQGGAPHTGKLLTGLGKL